MCSPLDARMSIWRKIRFGLRAFRQSARSRGLGSSVTKAARILRAEGPAGIAKRLRALMPLPRAGRGDARACLIVATPHVEWIARMMARLLQSHGFRAEVTGETTGAESYGHVFVLAPQMFDDLPPDVIAFQLEQHVSARWMTPAYMALLGRARAVMDYSADNIARLTAAGLPVSRLFHVPLSADPGQSPAAGQRDGVVFVGDTSAPRRQALLRELRSEFPQLHVETALFGAELDVLLDRAKVVLNLHYYDNALLETARIHQSRSHGAWVVSETAADQHLHGDLPGVLFAPVGDTEALTGAVRTALAGGDPPAADEGEFAPWFRRALLGMGIIAAEDFDAAHPDWPCPIQAPPRLCLSLRETPARRAAFLAQSQADGYQIWEGLRAVPGWRGAALSYRQMFRRLQAEDRTEAIICEDDVIFPEDFGPRLASVKAHLSDRSDWDMFSGFIADLSPEAHVTHVVTAHGETFVTLDRAVSMVFNIYRGPVIDWLARWDPSDDDAFQNTIDRRLESYRFRIVTTLPFLVGHREDAESTLREFRNAKYHPQVAASERLIREKVAAFRAQRSPIS